MKNNAEILSWGTTEFKTLGCSLFLNVESSFLNHIFLKITIIFNNIEDEYNTKCLKQILN